MRDYTPGWRNKGDIADAFRGARPVTVDARATVSCDEAHSLRAESLRTASQAGGPLAVEESSTNSSAHAA